MRSHGLPYDQHDDLEVTGRIQGGTIRVRVVRTTLQARRILSLELQDVSVDADIQRSLARRMCPDEHKDSLGPIPLHRSETNRGRQHDSRLV